MIRRQVHVFYGTKFLFRWEGKPELKTPCLAACSWPSGVPRTMRCLEPFHSTCGDNTGGSIGVFVTDRSVEKVGYGRNAGVRMQLGTTRCAVQFEVIQKNKWLQHLPQVARAHQPHYRPMAVPACPVHNLAR